MKKESGAIPIPRNVVAAVLLSILLAGCAQPITELWPPASATRARVILVSVDRWHSMIALRHEPVSAADRSPRWEEWGYAEEGYYLEGDSGCSGTMRALFVPSGAVVQVARADLPWSERTPQPPARSWVFHLSEGGFQRLVEFLERSRESPKVISTAFGCSWYRASDSYHAFHHCYHWTARALRSAGLPVWSFYSLFKSCLEAQLDRAIEFQDEDEIRKSAEFRSRRKPLRSQASGRPRSAPASTARSAPAPRRSDVRGRSTGLGESERRSRHEARRVLSFSVPTPPHENRRQGNTAAAEARTPRGFLGPPYRTVR